MSRVNKINVINYNKLIVNLKKVDWQNIVQINNIDSAINNVLETLKNNIQLCSTERICTKKKQKKKTLDH